MKNLVNSKVLPLFLAFSVFVVMWTYLQVTTFCITSHIRKFIQFSRSGLMHMTICVIKYLSISLLDTYHNILPQLLLFTESNNSIAR